LVIGDSGSSARWRADCAAGRCPGDQLGTARVLNGHDWNGGQARGRNDLLQRLLVRHAQYHRGLAT
jgi:hypothetical protein